MPSIRLIALTLLLALSAEAGIVYRYTTKSTDTRVGGGSGGRVWVDGDRKRVEFDRRDDAPRTADVAITSGGKTTLVNLTLKTWYHDKKSGSSSSLFHLPWQDDRIQGKPAIAFRDEGDGPPVSGYATKRHVVRLSYRVTGSMSGVVLNGNVNATMIVLIAPSLPREPGQSVVRTGFAEIDDELAKHFGSLDGLVVGTELAVSRRLEGGAVFTEVITTTVTEIQPAEVRDSMFTIPEGFKFQEPVIGVPGM